MNAASWKTIRRLLGRPLFSPGGFAARALLLGAAFAVCHLAQFREFTGVLSGTPHTGWPGQNAAAVLAVIYMFFYFAAVLIAPVLLIAAGILAALNRLLDGR